MSKITSLKNQKGFSLIELMIVVAIIGILSAIAVPNYQKFQRKSRQSEAKSSLSGIYTATRSYEAEWGRPTASFEAMGYTVEGRVVYNCGFPDNTGNASRSPRDIAQRTLANANLSNTRQVCAGAVAPNCVAGFADLGADPGGAPAGGAAPVLVGANYTFTIECIGNLGVTANDTWQMDQTKSLTNAVDGT